MDFIERFVEMTDTGLSPAHYRRWVALTTVATVLDRKVFTSLRAGVPLFPNIFVLLVGPPGSGKSKAIEPARDLLHGFEHVALSPDSITHEDFVRRLGERSAKHTSAGPIPHRQATMGLFLSEWGTFLRKPSNDTLAMLATIYDCADFMASTIKRGVDDAKNCYVNIVAGCTPAWFAEGFPPNSYEQGLPTRIFYIWTDYTPADDTPDFDFGGGLSKPKWETMELYKSLAKISEAQGLITWTPGAAAMFNAWKADGFAPVPSDPMLKGYNSRRAMHVAKIAMLCAMSTHPKHLKIETDDLERAMGILFEAEIDMPKCLNAAGGNTFRLREEAVINYVEARFRATGGKPVPEWEVRQKLGRMVPPNFVSTIMDGIVSSQQVRVVDGKSPLRLLKPGVRK